MAIGGVEWVIVGVIAVVMLVWGPDQIPKLARMIGQARRQFELAQKEFANPTPEQPVPASAPSAPISAIDDALIASARRFGISTKGRTRDELTAEVARRAIQAGSVPAAQPSSSQAAPQGTAIQTTGTPAASNPPPGKEEDEHERLVAAARSLGINTEGKTSEQLKEEMRSVLA